MLEGKMWNGLSKKTNLFFFFLLLLCLFSFKKISYNLDAGLKWSLINWIWYISVAILLFVSIVSLVPIKDMLFYGKGRAKKEAEYNLLKKEIKTALNITDNTSIGILVDVHDYDLMIESNREKIQKMEKEFGRPFMHNLVQLSNFLQNEKIRINKISNLIFEDYYYISAIDLAIKNNLDKEDIEMHGSEENAIELYRNDPEEKIKKIAFENACDSLLNNIEVLEPKINLYNQLFLYGINMISALLDKNTLVFYRMYEKLDSLEVFNSEWENKQGMMLDNMNTKLVHFEKAVVNKLEELNNNISTLSKSIESLEKSVTKGLKSINSKLDYNNLLTSVNTVQLSQIKKRIGI